MGSSTKPNNLVAVLLLIRSKSGARLVFQCPSEATRQFTSLTGDQHEVDVGDQSSHERSAAEHIDGRVNDPITSQLSSSMHDPSSETVLGHKVETLEKLLAPGRWCDGSDFNIAIDGVSFIGQPCFAHESGHWTAAVSQTSNSQVGTKPRLVSRPDPHSREQLLRDFVHVPASLDSQLDAPSLATSFDSVSTKGSGTGAEGLYMFHVVFALTDVTTRSKHATSLTPSSLLENVARPLTKALRYLQEEHLYIETECRKILAFKSKARFENAPSLKSWNTIVETSELAWALKEVHSAVSTNSIAGIRLRGTEMALQTSDPISQSAPISPEFALLLIEDKSTLLRSLETRPEAAVLSYFVTHITPTKPLTKLATRLGLSMQSILFLSEHLIKWRKVRLIRPLHPRNTYTVAPDAPLERLVQLSADYANTFPALPGLRKMLAILGGTQPTPYYTCFPSRNHREAYMNILAWMVRMELVTRLKTVGWLKLRPDILQKSSATKKSSSADAGYFPVEGDDDEDEATSVKSEDTTIHNTRAIRNESEDAANIIIDVTTLAPEESAYIANLPNLVADEELRAFFPRLVQYFDGEHAFEDIAINEGIKRSAFEEWIGELDKLGVLSSVRCL